MSASCRTSSSEALIHSTGDVLVLADEDFDVDVRPLPQTKTLKSVERAHIQEVLQDCEWRINGSGNAAERLGLHPNTLRFRMKKLGIGRDNSLSAIGVSSRASRAS